MCITWRERVGSTDTYPNSSVGWQRLLRTGVDATQFLVYFIHPTSSRPYFFRREGRKSSSFSNTLLQQGLRIFNTF